ncbi:proline-rich protein hypothetical protein [Limosa lapponica baueri]|uniref:Uncharacterized protein n=1 Tax=Limosa lapponica baueri TaxID=1758121 RepID=A0A2I0TL53_LIMLA|nr:proline-rich protein hypothetical protein [Limosa lapponica baueri]
MERRFAQLSLSNTTTTMGSNISPGSNVLSHCADPHIQAIGDPAGDLPLPKEMLADCSLVSQDGPSRVPMPGYPGGTSGAISCYNIGSLSLPEELLTSDYSIPEASDSVLSLEQVNTIGMGPQEPWWDAGTNLPSPQLGRPKNQGQKRKSTFPDPPSKCRALAICTRVGKWD